MNSSRPFSCVYFNILPFRIMSGSDQDDGRCAVVKAGVVNHGGDVNDGAKHDDLGSETSNKIGGGGGGNGKKRPRGGWVGRR